MTWEKQEPQSDIWLPQDSGETIEGEVLQAFDGMYGMQFRIKTKDKELVTPSHKVLASRMQGIKEGDKVRITFQGTEPPAVKGQNPTRIYTVEKWKD